VDGLSVPRRFAPALLWFAVHALRLGRLPGQVAAAVPVTLLTFALSRRWVFRAAGPAMPSPSGSPTSTSTASGRSVSATSIADLALSASPTTARPNSASIRPARRWNAGSSSTTRTELLIGP
jgi:hypothetical protein